MPFPPGASANFMPQSSRMIVRNTQDNLELVDALVEQANVSGPKQVEIESKFVEINQNNLKELGFDWLLGQFNIREPPRIRGWWTSGTDACVIRQLPLRASRQRANRLGSSLSPEEIAAAISPLARMQSMPCLFPTARPRCPWTFWAGRCFHRPTIPGRDPRFESKEGDRSALGAHGHDQERPARRHRNRAGVSLSDAVRTAKDADRIWRSYRFGPGLTGSSTGVVPGDANNADGV